jgi:hypothetical protein
MASGSNQGRLDGTLERFQVRAGQLTLLPAGHRFHGYTVGLGIRGEVRLFVRPDRLALMTDTEISEGRFGLVRSMALGNPTILHAMAALGREAERPSLMSQLYAESFVTLTLTEGDPGRRKGCVQ